MNNSIKGEKHVCSNCGTLFFDLNKKPIICPKCKTEVLDKTQTKTKPVISDPKVEVRNEDKSVTENLDEVEDENIEDDLIDDDDDTTAIVNID